MFHKLKYLKYKKKYLGLKQKSIDILNLKNKKQLGGDGDGVEESKGEGVEKSKSEERPARNPQEQEGHHILRGLLRLQCKLQS